MRAVVASRQLYLRTADGRVLHFGCYSDEQRAAVERGFELCAALHATHAAAGGGGAPGLAPRRPRFTRLLRTLSGGVGGDVESGGARGGGGATLPPDDHLGGTDPHGAARRGIHRARSFVDDGPPEHAEPEARHHHLLAPGTTVELTFSGSYAVAVPREQARRVARALSRAASSPHNRARARAHRAAANAATRSPRPTARSPTRSPT